jgi:hypothetical protein
MAIEREVIVERPVERETIVTDSGGGGAGIIGGIIGVALVALLLFWFFGGAFTGDAGNSVTVDLPNVTVQE